VSATDGDGASGGGAGGSLKIQANAVDSTGGTTTAAGGTGGARDSLLDAGAGGGGGAGRIRIEADSIIGTTIPVASTSGTPMSGSGATWAAAEDTKLTGLAKSSTRRLRFLVNNSGGTTSGPISYELHVAQMATCGPGSYTAVDPSTHWDVVDSTWVTDGDPSSNVSGGLTDPGGSSWVNGELEDSADSTDTITLGGSEFTEIEFAVQATTGATDGANYCFKLTNNGTDLNGYSYYAEVTLAGTPPNSTPTLTVDEPDGTGDTVTVGQTYNIQYDLSDPDDVVTAAFYYDTDGSGLDGTAISGACASGAEGTNVTCSWDTAGMTPGSYYVYGITNDGTNPAVSDYSPGQITITSGGPGFCPAPNLVFSDGFESGDLTAWSGFYAEPGDSIAASMEQKKTGTYSAKATVDTQAPGQAIVYQDFTGQTTLYAQTFLYLDPSFATTSYVAVMQFLNGWTNILSASIKDDMTLYMWNDTCNAPNTGVCEAYGFGTGPTISKGQWHFLELTATISETAVKPGCGSTGIWRSRRPASIRALFRLTSSPPLSTGPLLGPRPIPYIDDAKLCLQQMSTGDLTLSLSRQPRVKSSTSSTTRRRAATRRCSASGCGTTARPRSRSTSSSSTSRTWQASRLETSAI
jgi:hypothetical protein